MSHWPRTWDTPNWNLERLLIFFVLVLRTFWSHLVLTNNVLTAVTQAKQIHRQKWSANKLCNTNRSREQLTRHLGSHMGMLRHRQTDTDRLIFPLIHWHGTHFMVIIILWALNSAECQKRTKQTQTYSEVQSHQRQTSLLSPTRPPGLCSTYQPVSSNLSQTQRLTAVKWDQKHWEQLFFTIYWCLW